MSKKNNIFLILILLVISLSLLGAFFIEYGLNHSPCQLCIYERIPYILSILLIIEFLFFKKNEKITLLILTITFSISTVLAFYHFGIEQEFFSDLSVCNIKNTSEALSKIEGIEDETANALIERAKDFYQKDQEEISNRIKDLGLENELIDHKGLTPGMLVTLGEQKILKLIDFADLASDELTGGYDIVKGERIKIKGYLEDFALSKTEADELIMSARDKVYKD